MGKRWRSFRCLKSKLSFGIILPFEVSKLSFTRLIKIILNGDKFKVNYDNNIIVFMSHSLKFKVSGKC